MNHKEILGKLESLSDPRAVEGMARFGIRGRNAYGISIPNLRGIAREAGRDHGLAQRLWDSGIHEARILAGMVDVPGEVTEAQMERWVVEFDSWDLCDQVCMNLFSKTPLAYKKAAEWSSRKEEFVKRAGFATMAALAVGDKKAEDRQFEMFLPIIKRESADDRNYVRKAVNWALRQIGKRNIRLNRLAIETAKDVQKTGSKAAKWIASDALRELASDAVRKRLEKKK